VTRKIVTLLLVLGLVLSLAAAGVMAAKGGVPPNSAGDGQYCNAGSGNEDETPVELGGNIECDPGNSPTHNNANDKENPPGTQPGN